MSIFNRVTSKISRAFLKPHPIDYGRTYGSYGINEEVHLAISTLNAIYKNLGNELVICDVGANIGEYASLLSSMLALDARIYCFEPSADHREILSTLEANNSNITKCYFQALSNVSGPKVLYKDQEGSSLASVYDRDIACHGLYLDQQENVDATTIDVWMNTFHISQLSFLKVDVEGHELEVFKGGQAALAAGKINAIQFEFGGCNLDSRTYLKDFHRLLVRNYGFLLYRLAPRHILVDVNCYHEGLESFVWQNFVAFRDKTFIPDNYKIVIE